MLGVGVEADPGEGEVPGVAATKPAAVVAEGLPGASAVAAVVEPAGRSRAPVPGAGAGAAEQVCCAGGQDSWQVPWVMASKVSVSSR